MNTKCSLSSWIDIQSHWSTVLAFIECSSSVPLRTLHLVSSFFVSTQSLLEIIFCEVSTHKDFSNSCQIGQIQQLQQWPNVSQLYRNCLPCPQWHQYCVLHMHLPPWLLARRNISFFSRPSLHPPLCDKHSQCCNTPRHTPALPTEVSTIRDASMRLSCWHLRPRISSPKIHWIW